MSKGLKIIKALQENINSFEGNFPLQEFKEAGLRQNPTITLLTCADSRMPVDMFGPIFNRIFSVENIGNQYKNNAGSVLYGILHLHTPLLIIAGHSDCGAIKAAQSNFANEPFAIRRELYTLQDTLVKVQEINNNELNPQPEIKITQLAELNVDMQISHVLENENIRELVDKGDLSILGVMVDLHNVYANGYGKIYITNLNGEINTDMIKEQLKDSLLQERIKRLI